MKNKIASFSVALIVLSLVLIDISAFISQLYGQQQTPTNIMGAQINSKLQLFLNGEVKNDNEVITVEFDDDINVTVFYSDLETGNHIPNATVELVGWGSLNETNNQYYNITISSNDLEQGITIFTVLAEKENYQPQTIHFFIEVVEKSSQLQLFLDSMDKTNDPTYEITINEFLNITVKYTDNESQHITGATIQLIGEGLTLNFTEQSGLEQYYLLGGLNTTDLGIGVKLLTIIAQAPNYSIKSINLRITVNRIIGTISRADGNPQIEVYSGDDVTLNIILKDPYNNTIKGAIVTYTWAYGQGELDDSDNDGIYNITLYNVPEGNYVIKINAWLGDDYTFQEYEMTLIVSPPPSYFTVFLSLLILLLLYIITLFS
jgi:hypothetical protein